MKKFYRCLFFFFNFEWKNEWNLKRSQHFSEYFKLLFCDWPKKRTFNSLFWKAKWTFKLIKISFIWETFKFCSCDSKFCIPTCIPVFWGFWNSRYCQWKSKVTFVNFDSRRRAALLVFLGCMIFPFEYLRWYFEDTSIKGFAGKVLAKFSLMDASIQI